MVVARCDKGVKARCTLGWERTLLRTDLARSDQTPRKLPHRPSLSSLLCIQPPPCGASIQSRRARRLTGLTSASKLILRPSALCGEWCGGCFRLYGYSLIRRTESCTSLPIVGLSDSGWPHRIGHLLRWLCPIGYDPAIAFLSAVPSHTSISSGMGVGPSSISPHMAGGCAAIFSCNPVISAPCG